MNEDGGQLGGFRRCTSKSVLEFSKLSGARQADDVRGRRQLDAKIILSHPGKTFFRSVDAVLILPFFRRSKPLSNLLNVNSFLPVSHYSFCFPIRSIYTCISRSMLKYSTLLFYVYLRDTSTKKGLLILARN